MLRQFFLYARRSRQKGQSLVEVTVGFVVLLFIVSGVLDLGRAYFAFISLEDGAGEAALYLSINPECRFSSDGPQCANPNNAEYRARYSGGNNVDWSSANITITRPAVFGVGEPVSVRIEYPFRLLTPLVSRIAAFNPITLTAEASQIIIRE